MNIKTLHEKYASPNALHVFTSAHTISILLVLLVVMPLELNVALAQSSEDETTTVSNTSQDDSTTKKKDSADALASEESLTRFQQLLERRPFHTGALSGLVKYYAERGELQILVQEYEQKVEALPDDPAVKVILSRLYVRSGEYEKAAELVERIDTLGADKARSESKLLLLKSEIYQRTGRLEAAREMLNQARAKARSISERTKLVEALADLYMRSKDQQQAAATLIEFADEFPNNYLHRKRMADALARRSLHESAIELYKSLLDLVENQTDKRCELLRQLGKSYERLEQKQDAIDVYSDAIDLLANGHWLQRELHERVVTLYRTSGRLEDLVTYCRDQIERSPEQTANRSLLADVLIASGDTESALDTLAEAVELFPEDLVLSAKRIELLIRTHDNESVSTEYERIISQYPDDAELYIDYGRFLANNQQLAAAGNQWTHVLQSELVDASLAHRLGTLFEAYALFDDAVRCYNRAITIAPQRIDNYTSLSRLWLYRGEKDKSVSSLDRLAEANPDDPTVHAALSHALMNLGLSDKALAAITVATQLKPDNYRYQSDRADLLIRTGHLDDALIVRRSAIELINNPPQQALAIDTLVSMYASAGILDKLTSAEEQITNNDPTNAVSLMILARAADQNKDLAASRQWLAKLLDAHPAHEEARRQVARVFEAVGDIESAVSEYKRLIQTHPTRARQYYQAIADLKLRYSDSAGAIETLQEMVQASPNNATVLKSVAEQLVRIGEPERAIEYFQQSLQIQPDRHEVRLAYANALVDAGQLEEAVDEFKITALQRSDRDSARDALSKLHETSGKLGTVDDLLEELQIRVENNPDETIIARTLAQLLIREYDYSRAMDLLDLVLQYNSRNAELGLVRAELLRRLTRFDDAIQAYREILRIPNIDRDFVLGEMGKAYFEAGRIDQATHTWRQINHKLYAGSFLLNNGLLDVAVEVFEEGIRLKPDDFPLHRNLIRSLQTAGRTDEALQAGRRLLDLEPDNVLNIQDLASAYIVQGDRSTAADIAGRLFSAGVVNKKHRSSSRGYGGYGGYGGGGMSLSMSMYYGGYSGYQQGSSKSNLARAIEFFSRNGLQAELKDTIKQQLLAQPNNAVLKESAVSLYRGTFAEPMLALELLKQLETATFPLEYQRWLGQSSQRDYMRVRQYQLIASKPALRDKHLAVLESKPIEDLNRDEILELAVIRQAQGANDQAIKLLTRAVTENHEDIVSLSALVEMLLNAELFTEAEPHAKDLSSLLATKRADMLIEMGERVRRDFVRNLPLQFQLRITDELLRDIAYKWTLGEGFQPNYRGQIDTMGYFRAQISLATIYAKTNQMDSAREIWKQMAPSNLADVDGWTMLADITQLHDQKDLAFEYYQHALKAAQILAADPLLQRIYGSSSSQSWYWGQENISSSFNKIVESFASRDKLVELYDFLRESNQNAKARRVLDQYKLHDQLKELYETRLQDARQTFLNNKVDSLNQSMPYFVQVCKLAELHDQTGDWPTSQKLYEQYLEDFPDELGLLVTLGEIAEAQQQFAIALAWEKKLIDAKERLSRQVRAWSLRNLTMIPLAPQIIKSNVRGSGWAQRWNSSSRRSGYGYGSRYNALSTSPSWIRIAQLHMANGNNIAAASAMERAIGSAGSSRQRVSTQVLNLIEQRQLSTKMLPVLRTLCVYLPTDERAQLAFAKSLEANSKSDVALEVYKRLLRRGVSDIGVLAQVRSRLDKLEPDSDKDSAATLASLIEQVANDPENANERLRLAKAYYYSLNIDDALSELLRVQETAPHLQGLHDLLIEIYTLKGESPKLIEALHAQVKRTSIDSMRRNARQRLVQELFSNGQTEEALDILKQLADPKNPSSYMGIGMMLHYFGRHDEAIEQFELAKRSQRGQDNSGQGLATAYILKGQVNVAADKIMDAIDSQKRQMNQYGASSIYALYNAQTNPFNPFLSLFVLEPDLAIEIQNRLTASYDANPKDPQATKLLMQFYRKLGRNDRAEILLEAIAGEGVTDQALVLRLIERSLEKKDYTKAIELAETFIKQQPKPKIPPGMPPQYAGMMALQSPRNLMLCKLGDIHWDLDDKDKAFEYYKQIVDKDIDETRLAYAAICVFRDRVSEARTLVENALAAQQVKSRSLLEFRASLAALEDKPNEAFDYLAQSIELAGAQDSSNMNMYYRAGGSSSSILAEIALQSGQIDRYVAFMQKAITKNPHKWDNYIELANNYYDLGRIQEALQIIDQAAQVATLKQQALQQRVEWEEKDFTSPSELMTLYRELIEISDRQVQTPSQYGYGGSASSNLRDRLGDLLWTGGDHDSAVTTWMQRMNLTDADSHVTLGDKLNERRAFDLAEDAYKEALALEPDNITVHEKLAELAYYRGSNSDTLTHLREIFLQSQESGDSYSDRYWYQDFEDIGNRIHHWAMDLARDPIIISSIDQSQSDEAALDRIMLGNLAGDWLNLEHELKQRLEESPFDPAAWRLLATTLQRNGNWIEATQAWEIIQRIELTTLQQRRDNLKLALAGKQIKEAVTGTRRTTPGSAQQMPRPSRGGYSSYGGYGGYYGYGGASSADQKLAMLYLYQGKFTEAERLILIQHQYNIAQAGLPLLASMTWEQGASERAIELMHLAVLLSGNLQNISQYAGMLADAGNIQEATELLLRAYRYQDTQAGSSYSMLSSWYGGGRGDEFESYAEQAISGALSEICTNAGSLDEILAHLNDKVADDPNDSRMAKLILSLQIRDRRWSQARESLILWQKSRPEDVAIKVELLHAHLQLQQWDEALLLLDQLEKDVPESSGNWIICKSFINLMQGDREGAIKTIEPLIDTSQPELAKVLPQQVWTILAVAKDYDRLAAYLESLQEHDALKDSGRELLVAVYRIQGNWSPAIKLALDNLWQQQKSLKVSLRWYRELVATVRAAESQGIKIQFDSERPEDNALLILVSSGANSGKEEFLKLVQEQPNNINAQRGLIFAADLAGDNALALKSNIDLLDWLVPKLNEIWIPADLTSLGDQSQLRLEQIKSQGFQSTSMLQNRYGSLNPLQGIISANNQRYRVDENENVTYRAMWKSHQWLQRDLLLKAGSDAEALTNLLQDHASFAKSDQYSGNSNYYNYPNFNYRAMARYGFMNEESFSTDWRSVIIEPLERYRHFEVIILHYADNEAHMLPEEWLTLGESNAAIGNPEEANRCRKRAADMKLVELMATDQPAIGDQNSYYSWRWRWYGNDSSQRISIIRGALAFGAFDNPRQQQNRRTKIDGTPEELWELALVDPQVETQFLELAKVVQPHWGSSSSLSQLISYYRAKENYVAVIEILERVFKLEELLQSHHLSYYIHACFKEQDNDRIEKMLELIESQSSVLKDDVLLARLVLLRYQSKDDEAQELELQLIDRCRSEPKNPNKLDTNLLQMVELNPQQRYYQNLYFNWRSQPFARTPAMWNNNLPTIASLAASLGIRYDVQLAPYDLTLSRLRETYKRSALHTDALRILELQLDETSESLAPRIRAELLIDKAELLSEIGNSQESRNVLNDADKLLRNELSRSPSDKSLQKQLARIYESSQFVPDHQQWYDTIIATKAKDPTYDISGVKAGRALFELGRYDDSWQSYKKALYRGEFRYNEATELFKAGMAAYYAGESIEAKEILRQALWRDPLSELALKAQELIDE